MTRLALALTKACPACGRSVVVNAAGRIRTHQTGIRSGERCTGSGEQPREATIILDTGARPAPAASATPPPRPVFTGTRWRCPRCGRGMNIPADTDYYPWHHPMTPRHRIGGRWVDAPTTTCPMSGEPLTPGSGHTPWLTLLAAAPDRVAHLSTLIDGGMP